MNAGSTTLYVILGGGVFLFVLLLASAFKGSSGDVQRRLARVGSVALVRKIDQHGQPQRSVRSTTDSSIPLLDVLIKLLPNPDKLRSRLMRTGHTISLGEYLLTNALLLVVLYLVFTKLVGWDKVLAAPVALIIGLGLPHKIVGSMGDRRIRKFLAFFPEAIDTMCRGLRSGLPITESIAAVGREMPDPIGTEFHRISDGVRMGKSLDDSMWEVTRRIDTPEFRFLIIAMVIQKETGGNLAETMGNLADLIRKRRQLRLKIKAMSAEAKASAMIIGSLPFIMFGLLMLLSPAYMLGMIHETLGKILLGAGFTWMCMGWITMLKMISFEL